MLVRVALYHPIKPWILFDVVNLAKNYALIFVIELPTYSCTLENGGGEGGRRGGEGERGEGKGEGEGGGGRRRERRGGERRSYLFPDIFIW